MTNALTHPDAPHVDKLLSYLQSRGFGILAVNDGGDEATINPYLHPDTSREIAVNAITAVDAAWLRIDKGGEAATLFLVLGNEPECLVCDYTCGLGFDSELEACIDAYGNSFESLSS